MRLVFMGTPDFAVPSLQALVDAGHDVCGVFSQPDRPVGRHQGKLRPTPVKCCALENSIPVFQPENLRDGVAYSQLSKLKPDLIVVVAYGRLLPNEILSLPSKGCINVHPSLLPKYRGCAPINWAIINGETETGVTIIYMSSELDAGDIITQSRITISQDETAEELHDRLSESGGKLLIKAIKAIDEGTSSRTPQDSALSSYAPMLSRALSPINWTYTAKEIHNWVRGLFPWPAASTDAFSNQQIKVLSTSVTDRNTLRAPGMVLKADKEGIDIACGDGSVLRILEVQAPGSRKMSVGNYLLGHSILVNT